MLMKCICQESLPLTFWSCTLKDPKTDGSAAKRTDANALQQGRTENGSAEDGLVLHVQWHTRKEGHTNPPTSSLVRLGFKRSSTPQSIYSLSHCCSSSVWSKLQPGVKIAAG